jgi:hypothetical protein
VGTDTTRPGAGLVARRRGALSLVALVVAVVSGCSAAAPAPEPSYGTLPTFLPSDASGTDSVLVGTTSRPALASQGDAVDVRLASNSVLATVTGPQVPGQGLPHEVPAPICTWTITLAHPKADLPIRIADFTTLDHLGGVGHPALVPGQPAPPAVLGKGKAVTFELRSAMTAGEGLMRWAPGSPQIVASWDFEIEND